MEAPLAAGHGRPVESPCRALSSTWPADSRGVKAEMGRQPWSLEKGKEPPPEFSSSCLLGTVTRAKQVVPQSSVARLAAHRHRTATQPWSWARPDSTIRNKVETVEGP